MAAARSPQLHSLHSERRAALRGLQELTNYGLIELKKLLLQPAFLGRDVRGEFAARMAVDRVERLGDAARGHRWCPGVPAIRAASL